MVGKYQLKVSYKDNGKASSEVGVFTLNLGRVSSYLESITNITDQVIQ